MRPPRFAAALASLASLAISAVSSAQLSLLLVPDTGDTSKPNLGDRICAFSPVDGSLVNANFVPKDGRMKQVNKVVQTPWNTLLMTDFDAQAIWEYGLDGLYIRTFLSTSQMTGGLTPGVGEGLQGLCIAYGKIWFVFTDSLCNGCTPAPMPGDDNAVWSIEFDGSGLTKRFATADKPELGVMRDIAPFNGGFLVSDSGNTGANYDQVEFISLNGTVQSPTWHDGNTAGSFINFPQQVTPLADGTVLVASFSSSAIQEISSTGDAQRARNASLFLSFRGVHPLQNGRWLATGGTRVVSIDPVTNTSTDIVNNTVASAGYNGSFRWVSPVEVPACFGDLDLSGTVDNGDIAFALLDYGACPSCTADLDGSGDVDFGDVALILLSTGPCQ